MHLSDKVETLPQIGEARLKKLHTLKIFTVEDLIEHFPRDYIDRTTITPIGDISGGIKVVKGRVLFEPVNIRYGATTLTKVKIGDNTGQMELVWFNQPYMKKLLTQKTVGIFSGHVFAKPSGLQMENPDHELLSGKELLSSGRIVPIYPSTDKLSQNMLRSLIYKTLKIVLPQVEEFLPASLLQQYDLCGRQYAVQNLHFPESNQAFFAARKRLVFEELFMTQLYLFKLKGFVRQKNGFVFKNTNITAILNALPFSLTQAQNNVVSEILEDFTSGYVMNRLVQGDVGSGKTAVAMVAVAIAVANGFQAVLMAPTETLALQHFAAFEQILGKLNISVALLCGSMKKKEKDKVKQALANGTVSVAIGTHALIQETVTFAHLGLAITDEQHRFGVRQRASLMNKGKDPHVLVMTATPIPRTLALILYGDLDVSIIDTLPPGRQPIDTSAVNDSYHQRIYAFIKKQLDSGRQAYVICSMIGQEEQTQEPMPTALKELRSVMQFAKELQTEEFANYQVGILHGKMKPEEKNAVMTAFSQGSIQMLIATTVIEVGINVPNATVMLIENADRFGLSQLHQLRGRVGRGTEKSYCILVTNSKGEVAKKRMQAMVKTTDGFVLSELDLQLRGPGEFFGTKQHGLPEMKLANLYQDLPTLKQVQEAILTTYRNSFWENSKENELLHKKISQKIGDCTKVFL